MWNKVYLENKNKKERDTGSICFFPTHIYELFFYLVTFLLLEAVLIDLLADLIVGPVACHKIELQESVGKIQINSKSLCNQTTT